MKPSQKKTKKIDSLWKKNKQKQLKLNPLFQITQNVQLLTLTITYSMYSPQGKVTIFSWVGAGKLTDQLLQRKRECGCSFHNGTDSRL